LDPVYTPFYVVMGLTVNGERESLGIWAGDGGEGAPFWLQVFSELKNRGVEDVLIAVYDGLKGLPEAITTTWERTVVQQCIVRLIRNSFRLRRTPAPRRDRQGAQARLHGAVRASGEGQVRRVRG
jgi:transposase-like protein